jgi:FkbM family methyltransferase
MSLKAFMRRRAVDVLSHPLFSRRANRVIRPVARLVPKRLRNSFPVSGRFRLCSAHFDACVNVVGDRDPLAARFFWNGLGRFEAPTQRALAVLLTQARSFVDVGANMGVYSLLVTAATSGKVTVHAFEPEPETCNRLQLNVATNGFSNIAVHPLALGDVAGSAPLYVPATNTTESSLLSTFRTGTHPVSVDVARLDDLDIGTVDLMKIDTEGTEDRVIRGALRTIARDQPIIICEVLVHRPAEEGMQSLLDELGYLAFLLTDRGLQLRNPIAGDPAYENLNFLLVHRESVAEIPFAALG